nr:vesicle transport through interaction with t-SNAREs homolog 1A-like [Oncorhynchus nerka]
MSSDFEAYEQDFGTLTAEITNKIGRIPKLGGEEKTQLVLNVDKQLEEVRELMEQMDLEVRELPIQSRGMYQSRLKSYKGEMDKLEKDFKRSRIAYSDEVRNELLGEDAGSSESQLIKLREELDVWLRMSFRDVECMEFLLLTNPGASVGLLQHSGLMGWLSGSEMQRNEESGGKGVEERDKQVGQEILANLHTDREKIQRSRDRLRETDANLGKSSRILTGMLRRIIQNRVLVFVLGAIILITIILAIYFNVRGH